MKTTYLKPVLDLEATGTKIKTLMKQRGITPRQLQILLDFPYVQTVYNWYPSGLRGQFAKRRNNVLRPLLLIEFSSKTRRFI